MNHTNLCLVLLFFCVIIIIFFLFVYFCLFVCKKKKKEGALELLVISWIYYITQNSRHWLAERFSGLEYLP